MTVRQRALVPTPLAGAVEGWMDDDIASAASQLFGSGSRGVLVVDARELLTSTARVVGAQLGELHFKLWMALITLHVAHGMPSDGTGSSGLGELRRMVWGVDQVRGGRDAKRLLRALMDLRAVRFTVPGYDLLKQCPAPGVSDTNLLIGLYVDDVVLDAYEQASRHRGESPDARRLRLARIGKAVGARQSGTIGWQMAPAYTQRLAETDLRRFDWTKAQQLRGVALALWMVFTSRRVPYRPMFGEGKELEMVEIPLTLEHCRALGVRAAADPARRRTLNEAGARVCAADRSFVAFEARGGRGCQSLLRIVRRRPEDDPLGRPFDAPPGQLSLVA